MRNRFTASRSNGSSATVEDADSVASDGLFDDSGTFNAATDAQLPNLAGSPPTRRGTPSSR